MFSQHERFNTILPTGMSSHALAETVKAGYTSDVCPNLSTPASSGDVFDEKN